MEITRELTDEAVLEEIGRRLTQTRLQQNMTQSHLAEAAGISKRTLERLEAGATSTQLPTLIRTIRALGLLPGLDKTIPTPSPSPIELVKLQGKRRKRASSKSSKSKVAGKWRWGE